MSSSHCENNLARSLRLSHCQLMRFFRVSKWKSKCNKRRNHSVAKTVDKVVASLDHHIIRHAVQTDADNRRLFLHHRGVNSSVGLAVAANHQNHSVSAYQMQVHGHILRAYHLANEVDLRKLLGNLLLVTLLTVVERGAVLLNQQQTCR